MGTIYYGGSATPIDIEDRALAHLKVVIAAKLRRGESFTVSWRHPDDQPRGRSTIWLHPSIALRFVFEDPEPAVLSREWLEELANSANSTGGISLVSEHFDTGSISTVPDADPADPEAPEGSEPEPATLPPIESWWPHLEMRVRHVVLRDPHRPLSERVRKEIERITRVAVAAGTVLSEQDVSFVMTQQEPVD